MRPKVIDLFCGAGGMSEGLIQAGFHIVFSSDINDQVELTYRKRHEELGLVQGVNTHFERADIRSLNGDLIKDKINGLSVFENIQKPITIDAIFGGPPCQGFSRAGRRDSNDPRNMLFKEYLRVISEINPSYVVMENVEGFMDTILYDFIGLDGKVYRGDNNIVDILLKEFDKIGYLTLEPKLLDASDFGVPQKRKRAIFIAYKPNVRRPIYPEPTYIGDEKVTIREAISDLITDSAKKKKFHHKVSNYQKDSRNGRTPNIKGNPLKGTRKFKNHELSNHSDLIKERFSLFHLGEDTRTLKMRIINEGIDLSEKSNLLNHILGSIAVTSDIKDIIEHFKACDANSDYIQVLLTKKNNRMRLDFNSQAPTVLTLPDDFISPFEDRILSVREMARLQSFDDSFEFLGKRTTGGDRRRVEVPQYTQVGNAVPPLLSKAVATEIIKALKDCE
ncbi:DNA cytosine methyltransferase [Acetoanaerobium noterae]|uniref:DNA cytosine methyltransferase n=1 Tax=Acetoanaerobium noterae TaxID=745369 RepID=UPI00333FC5DC